MKSTLICLLCLLTLNSSVFAQENPLIPIPVPPAVPSAEDQPEFAEQKQTVKIDLKTNIHKHDGFFLRLTEGFGFMEAGSTTNGENTSIYGLSGIVDMAVGYSIMENFAITFNIFGGTCLSPTFKQDNLTIKDYDVQMTSSGVGGGFTYYFMPINLYISLQIGASMMQMEDGFTQTETDLGFGIHTGVGKEWWISDNWGIGVAGQTFFMIIPDKGGSPIWTIAGSGLAFTATYN